MATKTYSIKQTGTTILTITITEPEGKTYSDIQWDSKTGLVTAIIDSDTERKPIPYIGKSYGTIQPGPFEAENIYSIKYNYQYY